MSQFTAFAGLTSAQVQALIARNEPDGVAGLYACKTILNEHRPVCTRELHLMGQNLGASGFLDADNWTIIDGNGAHSYASRQLLLETTPAIACTTRACIPYGQSTSGNFMESTYEISTISTGAAGTTSKIFLGMATALNAYPTTNRAGFVISDDGSSQIVIQTTEVNLSSLPLGRNLTVGDIITVRFDRVEGSSNIDIVRFYVNGQKQYESTNIVTGNLYAGFGAYTSADATGLLDIAIKYFSFRRVP